MKQKIIKYKYFILTSIAASIITCGIFIQKDNGSVKVTDSIFDMKIDNVATDETANFNILETKEKGIIVDEKIATNPVNIFSNEKETKYNLENIDAKTEPVDTSNNYCTIQKGTELNIVGYNNFGYAKILYGEQELYIKNENLINNKNEIFFETKQQMYSFDTISLYEDFEGTKEIEKINQFETITVIGTNDSSFYKVIYNEKTGYILKSNLINAIPKESYIETGDDGITEYYFENIFNGVLSEIPDDQKTEENVQLLARLIHCEAGGQTEQGKLSVGTVVANRVFDKAMGTTIRGVIERPGQFSPVASGALYNCNYSESDYAAAKKVLIDGYRSFPAYVLYFQSIRDGYFSGQKTYEICYNENKKSPQYFSYKKSDLDKYQK